MLSGCDWLGLIWPGRRRDVITAYRERFDPNGVHSRIVLADLARLCRAGETTMVPGDPHGTAFNEGMRAVWLHIQGMCGLALDDIPPIEKE